MPISEYLNSSPDVRTLQVQLVDTTSSVCLVSGLEITDLCHRYKENYTLKRSFLPFTFVSPSIVVIDNF
jgi:hypothetical protein